MFCQRCKPLRPSIGYRIRLSSKTFQVRSFCDKCGWDDLWEECPPKLAETLPIREVPFLRDAVERPANYSEYLKSEHWKEVSERAKERDGFRCRLCNGVKRLTVHHRDYSRLGHEELDDLTTLCQDCHSWHHGRAKAAELQQFLANAGVF